MEFSRCRIMGILNVTPDSFSDGGQYGSRETAADRVLQMQEEGADIIDIGGESTRPGAAPVPADEEIRRVVPVIETARARCDIPISIDTRKAAVAEAALAAGADMINDISALRHDPAMAELVARRDIPVVLMHMLGTPETMQRDPQYNNVVEDVLTFFRQRLAFCKDHGIHHPILDPGIGFGKTVEHNLALMRALPRFSELGHPLLAGTSRKSFIGKITGLPVNDRLAGSVVTHYYACQHGAHLLRVHDVAETRAALALLYALERGEVPADAV